MITFHKTSLRLAGLYLAILMAICLFFSASIYQVSISELERGLRRPLPMLEGPYGQNSLTNQIRQQLINERQESYEQARDKLVVNLVVVNLTILLLGGILSYYLALRTLKPIEDAHAAQSTFAANASHELRTPITAMRSENEVALMDPQLTLKQAKEQLQSNIEELEKLTALSEGLLRLAKTEGAHITKVEVRAKEIIENAVRHLEPIAKKREIKITANIPPKATVWADPTTVTEIVTILLDNAVKYSPEKSDVTITVESGTRLAIHIADTGPGIPEESLPHIFDRFYRVDSSRTKQKIEGYGLGLAIAKGLAAVNDGELSVASVVGKGSTFTLTLPKQA